MIYKNKEEEQMNENYRGETIPIFAPTQTQHQKESKHK